MYDFLDMFRQMVERMWKEYIEERPGQNIEPPAQVMDYVELVMETEDCLVEQKRLPGENNVCIFPSAFTKCPFCIIFSPTHCNSEFFTFDFRLEW